MKIEKEMLLIENETIYLRPLLLRDITDEYVNGLNDPEVNKFLVNVRRCTQTKKSVEEYVLHCYESPEQILFGIFIENDDLSGLVGTIHVSGIDLFHYVASIGICIFEKRAWKRGCALQSLKLVKDYLFRECHLHYIEAGVFAKNTDSINLFTRAGFTERYRVKDKVRLGDAFEEVVCFSAIDPSFDISRACAGN